MANKQPKQTKGQVFKVIKCHKIPNSGKDFMGMVFQFLGTEMELSYGVETGNRLFWTINGKTQQTDKGQFYKWLNQFVGSDVRKIAGYTKLMRPLGQGATNGSDNKPAGNNVRASICGVPVFTKTEIKEMKDYQLIAFGKQLAKATERNPDNAQLDQYHAFVEDELSYRQDMHMREEQEFVAAEYERMARENAADAAAFEWANQEFYGDDEVASDIATSGSEGTESADGVKEEHEEYYSNLTMPHLKNNARLAGITGYSGMRKAELVATLVAHEMEKMAQTKIRAPF